MVWKQDLAKLKQQLNLPPDAGPPVKPKVVPKAEPKPIQDEDNLFLSAMGLKPKRSPAPLADPAVVPEGVAPADEAPPVDFASAMSGLPGVKTLSRGLLAEASAPRKGPKPEPEKAQAAPPVEAAPAVPEPLPTETLPPQVEVAGLPASGPRRIQLAAGMAVEVDGALDLRGHSVPDGMERLRERIHDAQALGWRTLLVTLGEAEPLREAFLDSLRGPMGQAVSQFAQAPIPMGGGQAWILYFQ